MKPIKVQAGIPSSIESLLGRAALPRCLGKINGIVSSRPGLQSLTLSPTPPEVSFLRNERKRNRQVGRVSPLRAASPVLNRGPRGAAVPTLWLTGREHFQNLDANRGQEPTPPSQEGGREERVRRPFPSWEG